MSPVLALLTVEADPVKEGVLQARLTLRNLDRLDVFLDGRPQGSLDAVDGERGLVLYVPSPEAGRPEPDAVLLLVEGYRGGALVAARRLRVRREAP